MQRPSVAHFVPGQFKSLATQLGWLGGGADSADDAATDPSRGEGYFGELKDTLACCSGLTWQQRITGFFLSLVMGVVFIIIAVSFIPIIAIVPKKFAFFFTCGNFFSVAATSFLVGPAAQLKSMFESHRAQAAGAYVVSSGMTLVSALYWRSAVLSIAFAAIQISSVVWYALSYVPFARRVVALVWSWAAVILKPVVAVVSRFVVACCSRFCIPKC